MDDQPMEGMKKIMEAYNSKQNIHSYRRVFHDIVQEGKFNQTLGTDYTPEVNYFYSKAGQKGWPLSNQ